MVTELVERSLKRAKIIVNKEDYRFGITMNKWVGDRHFNLAVCNCGQHLFSTDYNEHPQCDNCGNDYFVATGSVHHRPRFVIPYLEALHRDHNGFKVKRTNLSVIYTGEEVIPIQENLTRFVEYDMRNRVLKIWKGEELEFDSAVQSNTSRVNTEFFTKLDQKAFLDFVSTDMNRDLILLSRNFFYEGTRKKDIFRALLHLMRPENQYLQVLNNAGIPKVNRFRTGSYADSSINKDATKPHEILKVPKFMIPYFREDESLGSYELRDFQKALRGIESNKFKEIMSVVKDEGTMKELSRCINTLMEIHTHPEYSNIKKLVLYLFREVKMTQGFNSASDAITYLRDYIRMSKEMQVEFEKYPKSLKKEHDLITRNYNLIVKGRYDMESFTEAVNIKDYQKLKYIRKNEDFCIITPQSPDDLIREGSELSHCVASYVKSITEGKCKIVFMRRLNRLDQPFITIEVRGLNIRQAKGYSNRSVTAEQKQFIKEWAKDKGLVEAYY